MDSVAEAPYNDVSSVDRPILASAPTKLTSISPDLRT
jgi:hypothetical protein